MNSVEHFVSRSCVGEYCWPCRYEGKQEVATHKLGEEIPDDAPPEIAMSHNLTQYVCCKHFGQIVGDQSAITWRGCSL